MLTATKDLLLPTTVTGSWPRPSWFDANLFGRPFSTGMADLGYREQFVDAVSCVISDQELAGLDILTDGDFHLDHDLAGRSWFSYPTERLSGVTEYDVETTDEWTYPVGTWLNEIVGGWKYHAVLDKIGPRVPLEFAKIWRVAQARAHRPVKFGTVSPDISTSVLKLKSKAYSSKQQVMWDLAGILNQELRALAAAGCKVIQIEEPAIHSQAAFGASKETLDFLVDLFNHTVEGLEGTELWIHTCWGNPGAQNCFPPDISYDASMDIYLNRLKGDVWTIESKENNHRLLPAFAPYKGRLPKKIAVGFISHRQLQVETADEVAADVRKTLEYIDADHLILSSDCGFGRQGVPRPIALYKAAALAQGANLVRKELGAAASPVPAADPALQVDVPAEPVAVG
jgi:5-methyltetrahydropteroyltriglutamate--homocysteine methyltransferase